MKSPIKKEKRKKDWYRLKQYPHIGLLLEPKDRIWIEPYVKSKKNIEKHAFFPFIHRRLVVRKFRKEIYHDGTRSLLRKPSNKQRKIFYSNHLDSNVYSYYAEILSKEYEKTLSKMGISECITAYRQVKVDASNINSRNKCNIDFANDVFQFIKQSKGTNLVAITFDIKSFFDNLNHKLLKKYWRKVINSGNDLPPDHYNVFRNITKFSYINENDLFLEFKDKIIVERNPGITKEAKIKNKIYLRNKRAVAYCSKDDIDLLRRRNLIKANKYNFENGKTLGLRVKGIPQGSPISSILANVYMLEFDKSANDLLKDVGGIYRRYSDDMIAVCRIDYEEIIIDHFLKTIENYLLEIQTEKTHIFHFYFDSSKNRHMCFEKNVQTKSLQKNTFFEFLGFQFDGYFTMLKSSSISGYYRKMKRGFARGRFYTFHNRTKTKGELFKSRLYKRFTHLGSSRRRKYIRDPNHSNRFILSYRYDWGNFLTYAKLAAKTIPDNKIQGQVRRHWKKFHDLIHAIESK
jgi:hypothetical protein